MRVERFMAALIVLFVCVFSLPAFAGDQATPAEIIKKVQDAAAFLSDAGDEGLKDLSTKDSRWVWKDT